jgi:hypothetical protein
LSCANDGTLDPNTCKCICPEGLSQDTNCEELDVATGGNLVQSNYFSPLCHMPASGFSFLLQFAVLAQTTWTVIICKLQTLRSALAQAIILMVIMSSGAPATLKSRLAFKHSSDGHLSQPSHL